MIRAYSPPNGVPPSRPARIVEAKPRLDARGLPGFSLTRGREREREEIGEKQTKVAPRSGDHFFSGGGRGNIAASRRNERPFANFENGGRGSWRIPADAVVVSVRRLMADADSLVPVGINLRR